MSPIFRRAVADLALEVETPVDPLLAGVETLFGAFPPLPDGVPPGLSLTARPGRVAATVTGDPARTIDRRLLDPPLDAWHLAGIASQSVLAALESTVLLLHGSAVLSRDGTAAALIGPSGSGKTSLALDLEGSGLPLLCEGQVPVRRSDGLVLPFPRGLEIVAEGGHPGGKRTLPGRADSGREGRRPGMLLFLHDLFPGLRPQRIELACRNDEVEIAASALRRAGVEEIAIDTEQGLSTIAGSARPRPGDWLGALHRAVLDALPDPVYLRSAPLEAPDWSQPATIEPVSAARAVLGLLANTPSARHGNAALTEQLARSCPAFLLRNGSRKQRQAAVLALLKQR